MLLSLCWLASVADAQPSSPPWKVGFQPTAQAQSTPLTVTIVWCDKSFSLSAGTRTITFKGQNVTSQFSYTNLGFGLHDCASYYSGTQVYGAKAVGTINLTADQIDRLKATIYNANGTLLSDSTTYTPGVWHVSVTPHGGVASPAPNTTNVVQQFVVTNNGNASATYSLSVVTCSGGVQACSASNSVTVGAGSQATVNVSYTTGAAYAKGIIELRASKDAHADVGTVYVNPTPTTQASTRVLVAEVNPGPTIERASCLTFAIVRDIASECGVLRVTHPLPSIRTLNRSRTPTLIHYSDHVQQTPVSVHVMLADTATIPDEVQLQFYEVQPDSSLGPAQSRSYDGQAWASSRAQRLTIIPDWGHTRVVSYQVHVRLRYGAEWKAPLIAVGEMAVVNRMGSRFGAGWWLAGLERLFPGQSNGAILWVGGDGSTRRYRRTGVLGSDTVHVADTLTRPDTLFRDATGVYRRSLPTGLRVYFDATGRHTTTVNRLGHTTRFVWGAVGGEPRLDSIIVPTPAGVSRAYAFIYAGDTLKTIRAPGQPVGSPREVHLTRVGTGGRRGVSLIIDPSGDSVRFEFQNWGADYAYGARIDRRGTRTTFENEPYSPTIAYASTPVGGTDTVRHEFRTVPGIGAAPGALPLRIDSAYFRHDGPRVDLADVTKFWLDRFGAPHRIVNALGHVTTVRRDDWRFPAAVTRVEYPTLADGRQRIQTAAFDARGNLIRAAEVKPYGIIADNRDAVTRYEYTNASWPTFVTRIVSPERDSVMMAYNADGNRTWQQDARGDSTRVYFHYGNPFKLPSAVQLPGIPKDSVEYSSELGNLYRTRSPMGEVTTIHQDALGRDTIVLSPLDFAHTTFRRQRSIFDEMDRLRFSITIGDSVSPIGVQSLWVENTYDKEGNLESVSRWSDPDLPLTYGRTTTIGKVTTRWEYDGLNRTVREYAPDATPTVSTDNPFDETRYDLAGNPDTVITRRGDTLSMSYDELSRLIVSRIPRQEYASRTGIIQNPPDPFFTSGDSTATKEKNTPYPRYPNDDVGNPYGYTVHADSAVFSYDALGNLLRADNRDAWVRRGYFLNGLVRVDTLRIRTVAEISDGGNIETAHRYALTFKYDLNGRRIEMRHPIQLAPAPAHDTTRYAYSSGGLFASLTDPLNNRYGYQYNRRGERIRMTLASRSAFGEEYDYNDDGHLVKNLVYDTGVGRRGTDVTYHPGGKMKDSYNSFGTTDSSWAQYSGLGHVVTGALKNRWWSSRDGLTGWSEEGRRYSTDALGNVYSALSTDIYQNPSAHSGIYNSREQRAYEKGSGRLVWVKPKETESRRDTVLYDLSGNNEFETTLDPLSWQGSIRDRAYFYGADQKLRATDSRSYSYNGGLFSGGFEEFRYDALGRRVLVITRRYCKGDQDFGPECNLDWVRRTVWDGSAELYEIQMPLDPTLVEADTGYVNLDVQWSDNGTLFDPNPFFGRVLFTHGPGIDQPQSIIRMGYGSRLDTLQQPWSLVKFPSFAITPLWDPRGQADMGMYSDVGWSKKCQTTSGRTFCDNLVWFDKALAYERANYRERGGWHGSLLRDKRDATGLLYRRNRYYDPATGRFTQEDPIGLAGGLNLYGFADGDPVNYSDPFGLSPCWRSRSLIVAAVCQLVGASIPAESRMLETFRNIDTGEIENQRRAHQGVRDEIQSRRNAPHSTPGRNIPDSPRNGRGPPGPGAPSAASAARVLGSGVFGAVLGIFLNPTEAGCSDMSPRCVAERQAAEGQAPAPPEQTAPRAPQDR